MLFATVNPFVRNASRLKFSSGDNPVMVVDCRIFYILHGTARVWIGGRCCELRPSSLFYCCGGSRYNLIAEEIEYIALNFDLTQRRSDQTNVFPRLSLSSRTELPQIETDFVEDADFLNDCLFIENAAVFASAIQRIVEEYSTRRLLYREAAGSMLKELLVRLHRYSLIPDVHSSEAVNKAIAHINVHYAEPLSNRTLSDVSGYHINHLNRLFLRQTGTTAHQYLLNIRIEAAKKLLLNTDLPLSDIAEQTGFNSSAHFSSYFRKTCGASPSEYRKNLKNMI